VGGNPEVWVDPWGLERLRILVPPGGPGGITGAHVYIGLDYINPNNGGVWYGFYPVDPGSRKKTSTGPGVVVCGDDPGQDVGRYRSITLNITHDQARTIYRNIVGDHPAYDVETYNCSTWAADVLRPVFQELPEGIRTPNQLISCFDSGAVGS